MKQIQMLYNKIGFVADISKHHAIKQLVLIRKIKNCGFRYPKITKTRYLAVDKKLLYPTNFIYFSVMKMYYLKLRANITNTRPVLWKQ